MLKSPSTFGRLFARIGLLAIAVAIVMVPAMARSREQIERRDATRLSIRHSWLGVAPPTKAAVAPQPLFVLPALVVPPADVRPAVSSLVTADPAPRAVLDDSSDPLRGPPPSTLE